MVLSILDPCTGGPSLKGPRSEPLRRVASQHAQHSPAYTAKLRKGWRVIVPVRGRLTPRVIAREFSTQAAASNWLTSEEGQSMVALERARQRSIA